MLHRNVTVEREKGKKTPFGICPLGMVDMRISTGGNKSNDEIKHPFAIRKMEACLKGSLESRKKKL